MSLNTSGPNGVLATVTVSSSQIIGTNSGRNGLVFFNCSTSINCWIAPSNIAVATGQGIILIPSGRFDLLPGILPVTCGGAWVGICESSTVKILILEFYSP